MPSPTDFNLSPYYDDYDQAKKFHRILYRPGYAVQARELTQSQSILQNQIEHLSDHLFDKGAMIIPGDISFDLNYNAVKLTSKTYSDVSLYIGQQLTGVTSGVVAICVNAIATDGTDPDTLFVKYNSTGTNNVITSFTPGETINATVVGSPGIVATAVVNSTAVGSAANINAGVYYINGFHVTVTQQSLILDKYTNTPSYRVGLQIVESFVTPNDDTSLNDNAQGSSNVNAPGAHRFKIDLILSKLSLTSTNDQNFVELLRLNNGIRSNQVTSTAYNVLEDTLARRTYDQSGDYTVVPFTIDMRENLLSGTNRGIYTSVQGGDATKLAAGISSGKAYVKGYEIQKLATTYVNIDKARDYSTASNYKTNFNLQNYVNVTNVYGSPDVTFVSGDVTPYQDIYLFDILTSVQGTAQSTTGVNVPQIGRSKSRGFEYNSGSASSGVFASSSLTTTVFKHYLFDIEMFTHLNITSATSFTSGEKVTGGTSGAIGYVQAISTTKSAAVTSISVANPGIVTLNGHSFREGQQITLTGGTYSVGGSAVTTPTVYTVRNPSTNTFALYDASGINSVNVTAYSAAPTATHGVVILNDVTGTFISGETITGATSSNTAIVQSDRYGFLGADAKDFTEVKQLAMAGSPTYTADASIDAIYGSYYQLTGQLSIANSGQVITGFGTIFTQELRVNDIITFTTDAGATVTATVQAIYSDTSLNLTTTVGGSAVSTKTTVFRKRPMLNGSNLNTAIFKLPYQRIKSLKTALNSGQSNTNFYVRRNFTATLSNGSATINANSNEQFASLSDGDYTISVMAANSGSTTTGNILSLDGNNAQSTPIFTLGGSPTGSSLTLNFGTAYSNAKIKILATMSINVANAKTKTLNTGSQVSISSQSIIQSGIIGLGKADVYQVANVYMSANFSTPATTSSTDITSRFTLDTGQRDNYYDLGRLILNSGQLVPTGQLLVVFSYFSHGSGDFFSVDSYTGQLTYENIPSYASDTTGYIYDLRDCIDFRPRVADNSTINGSTIDRNYTSTGASAFDVVKFGSDVANDFDYYLPRADKIFLDNLGNFSVVKGSSSLNPQLPSSLDNAMQIATVYLNAYTLNSKDLNISVVDNKRYTMRDIGKLETRIANVEYYTQLSLLETQTQNQQIQDAQGFDRYKNGFIVDNFTGHGIGDPTNLDYQCSMDMANGLLRPMCDPRNVSFIEANTDGTTISDIIRTNNGYQKTGDLITLPYTEVTSIQQPYASHDENVNPFSIFTWVGSVNLSPSSDDWIATNRVPDLVVNVQGSYDTLVQNLGNPNLQSVEIGTVWNSWQDSWYGTPTETITDSGPYIGRNNVAARGRGAGGWTVEAQDETVTTSQQVTQTRTGIRTSIVPNVVTQNLGDKVLSVAFVPFIRSKTISFTATRLKPNTIVYPFFDGVSIASYVTPTGGSLGGNLISDANGSVTGTFTIPDPTVDSNPRWQTGTRIFRLTDSSTNNLNVVGTAAEGDYVAQGLLDTVQNSVISTRQAVTVRQDVTDTQNIVRTSTRTTQNIIEWIDPIAQSFLVDETGGVFVTSVDLFFSTKDNNIPVTVQLREMQNGYPTRTLIPFGEVVKNPSDINTSTDATIATRFTFPSPVYLQEKTEYCFAVISNSNNYRVYVGTIGENQLVSNRKISTNPYAGSFFKSQNGSTWTADQTTDIMFNINKAQFSENTGTVTFVNNELSPKLLINNPIRTTNSSGIVKITHRGHGMHSSNNYVTISGVPTGTYNGIASTALNGTFAVTPLSLDSYTITTTGTATASGDVGGNVVYASQNYIIDTANLSIQNLTVPSTNITYGLKTTSGRSIHGSETEFVLTSTATNVAPGNNICFNFPQMVASTINQTNRMSGSKSLFLICNLNTTNVNVSPIIDTTRTSIVTVQNRLNNPTSGNTTNFVADTTSTGTSSSAVYVTRPITLTNASTALNTILTSNVRPSASVRVYYRVTDSTQVKNINTLSWTPVNGTGAEDVTVTPATNSVTFKDYTYSDSGLTGFTAFQIKIVLKGTNSSQPPIISALRGIALAL
jgi:hypothetical protein